MCETGCSLKLLCQKLQISPLKTLKERSGRESRENSLRATLELSYNVLPQGAKEIFPLLAFFPGGLSEELATFLWKEDSFDDLSILLKFSMAEMPDPNQDSWRISLPEPARRYAASKQLQKIEDFAPKVLKYFYAFSQKIVTLLSKETESKEGKNLLLQESSNLNYFLQWGYEHEKRNDNFCYCARITALICKDWGWIVPGEGLVNSLVNALSAARRNNDTLGQADVTRSIADFKLSNEGLDVARESYQQSIRHYMDARQETDSKINIADILLKIGRIHEICQEIDLAILSSSEAFEIYLNEKEILKAAHAKIFLGQLEEYLENFDKALENYEEAEKLYRSENHTSGALKASILIEKINSIFQDIELKSERDISYEKLRDLLLEGRWKEADQETNKLMSQASEKKVGERLTINDIEQFPCDDLKTINRLWLYYSSGKFGFSIQKKIWLGLGGIPNNFNGDVYVAFCDSVGWRTDSKCVKYQNLIFDLNTAKAGHLPTATSLRWDRDPTRARIKGYTLFSRSDL